MEGGEGGVSRSGRIRKKSSKLRDYQSADDYEGTGGGGAAAAASAGASSTTQPNLHKRPNLLPTPVPTDADPDQDMTLVDCDTVDGADIIAPNRSIYMSEKSTKSRVVMRDGSTMLKRQPRKDKGRTRMTAYMLWARSVRSQMDDNLDFAAKSQRLGELWANVPMSERHLWKRRVTTYNKNMAKQAAKDAAAAAIAATAADKSQPAGNNSKFLNNRSRATTTTGTTSSSSRRHNTSETTTTGGRKNGRTAVARVNAVPPPVLESTDPINIAAHLKLLGDSLSNIGDSLEQHEHKGHNSITGTVSVLLDSLLCSVVPLISLTTQIEGFGHRVAHLKETLQDTLDNIAYVMPGLPF